MDTHIFLMLIGGVLILLVAWLPMVLRELPLSLPIFCVMSGVVFGYAADGDLHPLNYPVATERLTELVVIIALAGAGLKLDRPIGLWRWMMTWRLLGIAMPLSIAGIALVGGWLLGLSAGAALLLAAALAPTDPVLAADVQVGPPGSGEEDEVRFTLTAEAGLNDGLAFPFVNLAIVGLGAVHGTMGDAWLAGWFTVDVVWKLSAGIGVGWAVGWILGWVLFHVPNRASLSQTRDGFVALGVTFLAYSFTELAHGYGFLAVFIAALAVRAAERQNTYHERLHEFADQVERLLMMVLLVFFGIALADGLLVPLTWHGILAALIFIFVVRPVAGVVSLLGAPQPIRERAAIAFFGIRGLGSFYYLAYAINEAEVPGSRELWSVMGVTVLISIMLHGTTVTPCMAYLDHCRTRSRRPRSA